MTNLNFHDLAELLEQFVNLSLDFEGMETFSIADVEYTLIPDQQTYTFTACMTRNKQPHLVYGSEQHHIVFVWHVKHCSLTPRKVFLVDRLHQETPSDVKPEKKTEKQGSGKAEEEEVNKPVDHRDYSGSAIVTPIQFHAPFYGVETEGKIDTGADISSLHGTNIEVNTGSKQVSFDSDLLSDKRITMSYENRQSVSTADGGVEYRPVVLLDVTIAGKKMSGMAFNINDRSSMSHKVLIGQNILEKGKFLVDPAAGTLVAK